MQLELVVDPAVDERPTWSESTVPAEYGIRGFWETTLQLEATKPTANVLKTILGFKKLTTDGKTTLYSTGNNIGENVILEQVESQTGKNGRGIVYHVSFRAADTEEQLQMRKKVSDIGLNPTEVIDRDFFRSV